MPFSDIIMSMVVLKAAHFIFTKVLPISAEVIKLNVIYNWNVWFIEKRILFLIRCKKKEEESKSKWNNVRYLVANLPAVTKMIYAEEVLHMDLIWVDFLKIKLLIFFNLSWSYRNCRMIMSVLYRDIVELLLLLVWKVYDTEISPIAYRSTYTRMKNDFIEKTVH